VIKIGITGQSGFIGTHLFNMLGLQASKFERILFFDSYFDNHELLSSFVKKCDAIIHLAAVNRHPDSSYLYKTNIRLVKNLIAVMEKENVKPHVLYTSSIQEDLDNDYGKSKKVGRELFEKWATKNNASFTGMILPNVFGPYGQPNYNSFIATFCYKLTHDECPKILEDKKVSLIYIGSLCQQIITKIEEVKNLGLKKIERYNIPYDFQKKVSDILELFIVFKNQYVDCGIIPKMIDVSEINLFNTFRSYIDYSSFFPRKLVPNADSRGSFFEIIKLGIGGQISFSTTVSGVTRGNHFHTRKIERFTVIQGKAKIQLRRISCQDSISLYLDGNEPSYVDIPIWNTHNITNIGEDELLSIFWINEWYHEDDSDTYFESV